MAGRRDEGAGRGSARRRVALLAAAAVLALGLATGSAFAIAGIRYVQSQLTQIPSGPDCAGEGCLRDIETRGECADEPCTFLVLGSDSRAGLSRKDRAAFGSTERVRGQRADTIILVHVDPRLPRTVVLHVPRDLRVRIPGHGLAKVNSALEYGPNIMVRTVERLTGLPVDHYVQVNFVGFERLVEALGGVRVCVDRPMVDPVAGLRLPRAGCHVLDGDQALAFVRARNVEGDAIPDFSRISRQQQFMRVVIQKLMSPTIVLTDLAEVVEAARRNIVTDRGLNLYELQGLTRRLSGLGRGDVLFRVIPSVPVRIDGVEYVVPTQNARKLFERLRRGRSIRGLGREQALTSPSPATIRVRVHDAGGAAADALAFLRDAGFDVLPLGAAPAGSASSAILYGPRTAEQADVVSSYLGGVPTALDGAAVAASGAEVVVVVGADFPRLPR